MKSFRKPLIFLVVLLVLAGIAYWDEWQTKKDEKDKAEQSKLVELKAEQVQGIDYEKAPDGGAPPVKVSLARQDGGWRIKSPIEYPAESDTVETWIKTLTELSYEKTFDAGPEKLKDYGLADPKIKVSLTGADGQKVQLKIGEKSPVGYSNYLQIEGKSPVYLVSQYAYTSSNKELYDLRDKSLGIVPLNKVQSFTFQYGSQPEFSLEKKAADWVVKAAGKQEFLADPDEVSAFFAFFGQQRVERFLDEPSPELAKALSSSNRETREIARLKVNPNEGSAIELRFIENNGVVYARLPDQKEGLAALDKKILDGLKKEPANFQSRKMFSFNSTEAILVEIDGKKIEKKGDQWFEVGTGTDRTEFVRLMLVDLEFAKAQEVLTADAMGAVLKKEPLHVMRFTFKDQSSVDITLWDNPANPETVYLKRGADTYYLAQSQILDHFKEKSPPAEKEKIGGEG